MKRQQSPRQAVLATARPAALCAARRVLGAAGGSIGADLAVSLLPIPEAPTYAMLLAGLSTAHCCRANGS